jgi:hypothetical protein
LTKRRKRIAVISAALPLAVFVAYFGIKDLIYPPAAPTHDYINRGERAKERRADHRSAELCKSCHEEIYDQWRSSWLSKAFHSSKLEIDLHAVTLDLRGIDVREVSFCYECHAPLALASPADHDVEDPLSQEGVTCTVCHSMTEAHVDDAPARFKMRPQAGMTGPFDDARSPIHRVGTSPLFTGTNQELCGPCHRSTWPRSGVPIDWTYPEWAEDWEPGKKTCRDCHMLEYEGKAAQLEGVPVRQLRKHTFPGGHDPETVRSAFELDVTSETRGDQTRLSIAIENTTGHNLPTGNAAAPEYRLTVEVLGQSSRRLVAKRVYRVPNLMANGMETVDTTIADSVFNDTSLRAYERRVEVVEIDDRADRLDGGKLPDLEVRLEYSYRRPHDSDVRKSHYVWTVINHLSFPDVGLYNLTRTFMKAKTYDTFARLLTSPPRIPLVVERIVVERE